MMELTLALNAAEIQSARECKQGKKLNCIFKYAKRSMLTAIQ